MNGILAGVTFVRPYIKLWIAIKRKKSKQKFSNAVLFKYCQGLKMREEDIVDWIQKITQLSLDFIQPCLSAVVSCGWLFTSLIFKLAIQPMDNYL